MKFVSCGGPVCYDVVPIASSSGRPPLPVSLNGKLRYKLLCVAAGSIGTSRPCEMCESSVTVERSPDSRPYAYPAPGKGIIRL